MANCGQIIHEIKSKEYPSLGGGGRDGGDGEGGGYNELLVLRTDRRSRQSCSCCSSWVTRACR